jgi:hypothetical protein
MCAFKFIKNADKNTLLEHMFNPFLPVNEMSSHMPVITGGLECINYFKCCGIFPGLYNYAFNY